MERTWRVGHTGRDRMYYEERQGGQWQRIEVSGEMLLGRAHHVIYFASPTQWMHYPEWARHRRDEIIGRIKSEFREPDYEYQGDAAGAAPAAGDPAPAPALPRANHATRRPVQGMRALVIAVVLLLALSGGMSWLVIQGLSNGHTTLPMKRATLQRQVTRVDEPVMYWVSIGIYTTIGLGALGLGIWGLRERRRLLAG